MQPRDDAFQQRHADARGRSSSSASCWSRASRSARSGSACPSSHASSVRSCRATASPLDCCTDSSDFCCDSIDCSRGSSYRSGWIALIKNTGGGVGSPSVFISRCA